MKESDLVLQIVAEIKRDVDTNNLLALRETLKKLLKNPNNTVILKSFLSEFAELREPYL